MIEIEEDQMLDGILLAFNSDKCKGPDDDEIVLQLYAQMLGWA
jgi:hypothetical protein